MLRCGDVHRKTQCLGLLTCGLERDKQTPTLKGFTTDFLVEGDEILFVGRYQTHTHAQCQNGRTRGKRGDTVCALKSMSYIPKCWNWKGPVRGSISVRFEHTDNFTHVNIHKKFTSIPRTRGTLLFYS